ncbi:ferredoxin-thioredoxin reductase catalytic domain-containing protein [Pectinatus frisingensis]|jgi:ferredoxin-thioredoxin reductase catalytic subunit|uniref:ferredoxin-thioredoxin reductase catalytic domain-containing protein n=1 Tax=Pectinatus frisingensis TaxID=865 RepID=UPI0018C57637|nr:ferredoxin-thioredoxin reductase catalytic domain-containing protein [Pectinatus frisingensis]
MSDSAYTPEANAKKYGMLVNPKAIQVANVLTKLGKNESKLGEPYCPCLAQHNADTVCPCRYMRELKACRCGLYIRDKRGDK